jgi:hypothetical protein
MFYTIPGFALIAAAPFVLLPRGREHLGKSRTWSAALPALIIFLAATQVTYVMHSLPLHRPYASELALLKFQRALSAAMANVIRKTDHDKRLPTLEVAFEAYGRYITGDLMLRRRLFVKWKEIFILRRPVWQSSLRGTPEQKIATVHDRLLCHIDALATLEHPKRDETLVVLKDAYSQAMAERLLKIVHDRPYSWRQESRVSSPWGDVVVYLNLTRRKIADVQKDMVRAIATHATSQPLPARTNTPFTVETFFGDGGKEIAANVTAHLGRPATAPGQLHAGLAALRAPSKRPVAGIADALYGELTRKARLLVLPHETLCPGPNRQRLSKRQIKALWALEKRISQDNTHWRAGPVITTPYGPARLWQNVSNQ